MYCVGIRNRNEKDWKRKNYQISTKYTLNLNAYFVPECMNIEY